MSINDNIHDLVNKIWSPDIEETLEETEHKEEYPYQVVLKKLCIHAKACTQKDLLNPYIQLKDPKGKFLFNDRLIITSKYPKSSEHHQKDYSFDFIYDHNNENNIYCLMYSYLDNNKSLEGFVTLEVNKPAQALTFSDYNELSAPIIKENLERKRRPINDKIYLKITVHNYNPKTQHWKMIMPE